MSLLSILGSLLVFSLFITSFKHGREILQRRAVARCVLDELSLGRSFTGIGSEFDVNGSVEYSKTDVLKQKYMPHRVMDVQLMKILREGFCKNLVLQLQQKQQIHFH